MGDEIRPHLEWTISLDFRIIFIILGPDEWASQVKLTPKPGLRRLTGDGA